jgi:hypothetical protein
MSTTSEFTIDDELFSNTVLDINPAAVPPLDIISSAELPSPLFFTTVSTNYLTASSSILPFL